jgi:hypothetical protein
MLVWLDRGVESRQMTEIKIQAIRAALDQYIIELHDRRRLGHDVGDQILAVDELLREFRPVT